MARKSRTTAAQQYATNVAAVESLLSRLSDQVAADKAEAAKDAGNWGFAAEMSDLAVQLAALVRRMDNYSGDDDDDGTALLASLGIKR